MELQKDLLLVSYYLNYSLNNVLNYSTLFKFIVFADGSILATQFAEKNAL